MDSTDASKEEKSMRKQGENTAGKVEVVTEERNGCDSFLV
jgi:hypothetical protein